MQAVADVGQFECERSRKRNSEIIPEVMETVRERYVSGVDQDVEPSERKLVWWAVWVATSETPKVVEG